MIEIPNPLNSQDKMGDGEDGAIVQAKIFNDEGINWVSFTYKCNADLGGQEICPKDDEIEEARWFTKEEALRPISGPRASCKHSRIKIIRCGLALR